MSCLRHSSGVENRESRELLRRNEELQQQIERVEASVSG